MQHTTQTRTSPPIPIIVQQHAEEAAALRHVRSVLVRAPHVKLLQLRRLDDRLTAQIDGLAVAGEFGTACCTEALEQSTAGPVFAAAVNAIENRDEPALDRLHAIAPIVPAAARGLLSAFGWVSAPHLQGLVQQLLGSRDPQRLALGIAACRLQQVDPGPVLAAALHATHLPLQAQALHAAGSLGRTDLLPAVRNALKDEDAPFEAARALCLLGDHQAALPVLQQHALDGRKDDNGTRLIALALLLQAAEFEHARQVVRSAAKTAGGDLAKERVVLRAIGLLGDVQLVPWLIDRMGDDVQARLAGESFSMITGADLAGLDLERKPPENPLGGPNDDPDDDDVALDEDESLPWPDHELVQRWWDAQASRLPARGRCFIGASPGVEQCEHVLRNGTQRQRIAAAHYLCVLQPGRKLFNCAAPAWRQQRLLAGIP